MCANYIIEWDLKRAKPWPTMVISSTHAKFIAMYPHQRGGFAADTAF